MDVIYISLSLPIYIPVGVCINRTSSNSSCVLLAKERGVVQLRFGITIMCKNRARGENFIEELGPGGTFSGPLVILFSLKSLFQALDKVPSLRGNAILPFHQA